MRMVSVNRSVGGPCGTEVGLSLPSELHESSHPKGFPPSLIDSWLPGVWMPVFVGGVLQQIVSVLASLRTSGGK